MRAAASVVGAAAEPAVAVATTVPVDVLVVIGALVVCAVAWTVTLSRAPAGVDVDRHRHVRDLVRVTVAAISVVVLVVAVVATDFPRSSGASFWAEHALLTGVITTCALLGLGYVFVDRHERRQERDRQDARRTRERELETQAEAITSEMVRSVASDIFLIRTVYGDLGATTRIERARAYVDLQQEVVSDALVAARAWFVALSGAQHAGATPALTMLAGYMSHLRGVEHDIRAFQLNAVEASAMTGELSRACAEIQRGIRRADRKVDAYLHSAGIDPQKLIIEEFERRAAR